MSTACAPGTSERRSKYSCNTDEGRPDEHGMRAKVVLAAVSCESELQRRWTHLLSPSLPLPLCSTAVRALPWTVASSPACRSRHAAR